MNGWNDLMDGKNNAVWWWCMMMWWWCGLMDNLVVSRARSWTPPHTDCNSCHYLQGFLHPRWSVVQDVFHQQSQGQTGKYLRVDSRTVCECPRVPWAIQRIVTKFTMSQQFPTVEHWYESDIILPLSFFTTIYLSLQSVWFTISTCMHIQIDLGYLCKKADSDRDRCCTKPYEKIQSKNWRTLEGPDQVAGNNPVSMLLRHLQGIDLFFKGD